MDNQGPPPSTTAAGWALGLSLIPVPLAWIASVVLAIQVLGKSKYSPGHGKGMAIASLIIVPVWIVVLVTIFALNAANDADRNSSGAISKGGDVTVTDLRAGDCIAEEPPKDADISTVEVAPCAQPHIYEVYATFTLDDDDFPGAKEVERLSSGGCVKRFGPYVGMSFDNSEIDMTYMYPIESTWSENRDVSCWLTDGSATKGSLESAKR